MPHPRHRRLMRKQIGAYVLQPAGLTNVANGDATTPDSIANLQNIALYSRNGVSPSFAQAATGLLSDAVSNADGAWTAAGYTGETTNASTVGISAETRHYMLDKTISNSLLNLSSSGQPTGSVIVYTCEGPQSKYVPLYLGGAATTSSIKFGTQLTGSETNLVFRYFGVLPIGDKIQVLNPSTLSVIQAGSSYTGTGASTTGSFIVPKTTIATAGGYNLVYSSSAKTSTTPVAGLCVIISASA